MSIAAGAHDGPAAPESLLLEPPPKVWRLRAAAPDATAATFRRQLGLPEGPVVMSGHQAGFWHCGILAKWFALEAVGAVGAAPVWLVVDTDDNEPTVISYPARRLADGRLEARQWQAAPGLVVRPGTPTGARDAAEPAPAPVSGRSVEVPELVSRGIERMSGALRARAGARSLAEQYAAAAADVIAQATGGRPPAMVYASAVGGTDLFGGLVERMLADPAACAEAYNRAVAGRPEAQMRPLEVDRARDRIELPLWRISRGSPRRAVLAGDAAAGADGALAPRALLLTGLMRLAGCDLFIHGTGGGVYDQVMEAWLADWLGEAELAPSVVVSATRYLPLSREPAPAPAELEEALWEKHAARHDPAMVGEVESAARKREMVTAIAQLPAGDPRRASVYREMHGLLDRVRRQRREAIARLDARAASLRERLRDGDILLDRTWSLGLFPDESLRALRREIAEAVS